MELLPPYYCYHTIYTVYILSCNHQHSKVCLLLLELFFVRADEDLIFFGDGAPVSSRTSDFLLPKKYIILERIKQTSGQPARKILHIASLTLVQ